ncbi:MAG: NTP transferase domain-containing protein [Betaproteobacteria bacterium]|nr:NTP transferase domain-containing protein [Betaproteobacteria bacterium]
MNVILLAGGLGQRLRGAVPDVPKPLAPVAGRPFLEHLMDYWIGQGATRFVLSVGYKHEMVEAHFGAAYRSLPVEYAVEREPLDTGGALLLALAGTGADAPVFAANGDTFFALDAAAMHRYHAARAALFTMALFRATDAGRYTPVECGAEGRITAMRAPGSGVPPLANGGVYLIEPEAFSRTGFRPGDRVSLESELLPALLHAGARVFGFESEARFIDIGVPEDYARAAQVLPA